MKLEKWFGLKGRTALVTGATGHLGHEIASALCGAGARVILNSRNKKELEGLRRELENTGALAEIAPFDVTDKAAAKRAIEKIGKRHGLDILVNNAYNPSEYGNKTLEKATASDFAEAYDVAVIAPVNLIQAARPYLEKAGKKHKGGASVINIASMYASVSPDPSVYPKGKNNPPYYGAAKAGLLQLTRYAACHWADKNIRFNCISPGAFPEDGNPLIPKLRLKNPMKRTGKPEELAGAVVFLASDAASYITGANLPVDGGWTAW